ncbi:sigma-70 family RNA polymerase sigma factor [Thioclava atlantica]|uniref:ECF subfamily RNA polymerase sigma-24 factor n=1 Tax=Thioclava atlantica TaxID=1317124 RepID=A0A085TZU7_9RHOB|nr:sigma-70 family RNA polymerase sigma factor [Thioclava atlantica]KFE36244.1 ECF subfamily RNA polymerase sigma-24 factor [Thioclava atlantica]
MTRRSRHVIESQIPALRRFAFALTRDRDRADDLVQDCLARALSRWHLLRSEDSLRTWLFRILRNLHLDSGRRQARHPEQGGFDPDSHPGHAGNPETALFLSDVMGALFRLPAEQQEVLLLVGVEDFSYDATAEILGIPRGTVMSRLARGREALREMTGHERPPRRGAHLRSLK